MRRIVQFAIVVLVASAAHAADIDVVRSQFLGFYSAAGADPASPRMIDALAGLEAQARDFSSPDKLRGDGSWVDINYSEVPSGSWSPWDHTRRLIVMAKAYRTPGQALYNDPMLRVAIEAALSYVPKYYGKTTLPLGNWWFWTIGVPLDLGPTLVLMRGDVSQSVFDDCVSTLSFHIGSSPTGKGLVGPVPVGENLVWSCFTHMALALARDDAAMLLAVRSAMATVTIPSPAEGIKIDGSFQQHGAQLYTGGYGGSFANDAARYALITRNTSYALPESSLNTFANYVADGIAWSLYGNYFDVSVVGREVARVSTTGFNGVAALVQSSLFPSPRLNEIRAAAAKMLQSWQWTLPPELAALATTVERGGYLPLWPNGHRHYEQSDYTIHRRPGWFASVKMFSNRTKSGESTNDENILGSRESDGRFYLVLDGDEYFGRDIWPAIDWSRLPGITVERNLAPADDTYGYGSRGFVGGTGDGRNGVSAMDYAPLNTHLTAKKAWFFFDDSIAFLTNNITSPWLYKVETIVNQWPLKDPASPLTTGSNWLYCDRIGYYFLPGTTPKVERLQRTGTWASLGGSTDTTPHTASFLTISVDHDLAPANEADAYIIVPRTTAAAMRDWAAAAPISILANDSRVSAARDNRTKGVGIVFWAAGSFNGITTDLASTVYYIDNGLTVELYVSDPTNGSGTMHVSLPGKFLSSNGTFTQVGATTRIDVPRNGGRTYHTTLTRVSLNRRHSAR